MFMFIFIPVTVNGLTDILSLDTNTFHIYRRWNDEYTRDISNYVIRKEFLNMGIDMVKSTWPEFR